MLIEAWRISYSENTGDQKGQLSGVAVDKNEYWTWLYYIGTVILGMDERTFWRTQHRKLIALWEQHKVLNKINDGREEVVADDGYIDQFI